MSRLNPPEDVSGEEKSIGINNHCFTAVDVPVSHMNGDAAMWGRVPANDSVREVPTNKKVPPLAVLAVLTSVMVIEVVASDVKKLELVARARKAKFKNYSVNTNSRVTTWVDADCDGNISMLQDVEMEVFNKNMQLFN